MSVDPPKHELIQLIYRHLKEHGFHSAAKELQKHSPQGGINFSTSLLDIYSSWLKDSKREKQSDQTKHSAFKEKIKTSNKASKKRTPTIAIQTQAEDDCSSHSEELSQSLLPQTPAASSKSYELKTPIKAATQSPGPLVHAAADDSSDTTDISEEATKITPIRQCTSNNDAAGEIGKPKKKTMIKDQTPKKQSVSVRAPPIGKAKKKVNKPTKKEKDAKKSVPVKRKGTGEKTTIAKKSKTSMKADAAKRDTSDSDSSLDVEKWKKLILNMTETDVAKMDAINALDSSAPQPKKKRERKPPGKIDVRPPQSDKKSSDTVLVEDVTQMPAKSVKATNRSKKTTSLNSSNTISPITNTVDVRPLSPIQAPSKETLEEENVNVGAHSEVKIDQKSKKKKKKKEKMTEDTGENFRMENGNVEDGIINKEEHKKSEVTGKNTCNSRVETKDGKGNVDDGKEAIRNVEIKTVSIVQQKKLKKKKKTNEEGLEQKTEGEINFETTAEEENIVQSKKAKKKKQKEKIDADSSEKTSRKEEMHTEAAETGENAGEENSEPISNERKRKKKRKHHEGNLKVVDEKRDFKEQKDQENLTNNSECTDDGGQTAEVNHKNKRCSSIRNDSMALSPLLPSCEMLGPPSEKRKKKKSSADQESPVVPVQDTSASLQTPLSSTKKRKRNPLGASL